MKRLWAIALGVGALVLGGCNLVHSDAPMFTAADAAGQPDLKPGLWASLQPGCPADLTRPSAEWGDCASALVFRSGTVAAIDKPADAEPYVLASGDPRVLQVQGEAGALSDDASPDAKAKKAPLFLYLAISPVKSDAQGRITEARMWFVQCGPPRGGEPTEDEIKAEGLRAAATKAPLPGLTVSDDGGCLPANGAAVRNAAKASEAWAWMGEVKVGAMRWVRDKD